MGNSVQLIETYKCVDIVDLSVCLFVYNVCKERQFLSCSGTDFACFLNLKPTERPVKVRAGEKLRVCYLIASVAILIGKDSRERARLWTDSILESCGIARSYYDKHRSDICNNGTTDANKKFRKSLDNAIENAYDLT